MGRSVTKKIRRYKQISNFQVNDPQDPIKGKEFLDCVSKNYYLKTELASWRE